MRYTVQLVDPDDTGKPQNAIVRVLGLEHTGHSTVCMAHHLAPWCLDFMRTVYCERERPPSAKDMVLEVRKEALRLGITKAREPGLTEAALRARWLGGKHSECSREFGITRKQARDIMRAWEREDFELMPEEQDSLEAYAEADPDNVFFYRPGGVYGEDGEEDVRGKARTTHLHGWSEPHGSDHPGFSGANAYHTSIAVADFLLWMDHAVGAREGAEVRSPASDHGRRHSLCVSLAHVLACPPF